MQRPATLFPVYVLAGTLVFGLLVRSRFKNRPHLPYPPGPKRWPIIGSVFPKIQPWFRLQILSRQYGRIMYFNTLGHHQVVISSIQTAIDLLGQRGNTYSIRPISIMISDLMGVGEWNMSLRPNNDVWRSERGMLHAHMRRTAVHKYQGVQLQHARSLLKRILQDPERTLEHVKSFSGTLVMDVVYGIHIAGAGPHIEHVDSMISLISEAFANGPYLVEIFPLLRYLPSWVPGARLQIVAQGMRRTVERATELPMREVDKAQASGSLQRSFSLDLLEELGSDGTLKYERQAVRNLATQAYVAGVDTVTSVLLTFLLVMVKFPDVQAKAQSEFDRVIGANRLPTFEDKDRLPFLRAVISECMRWLPAAPMGLPHATTMDDIYDEYFIPKGTYVWANIWAMMRNPEDYPEPDEFKPDRFLKRSADGEYVYDDAVRDPRSAVFGFGRRVCPGRYFAEQSVFAVTASILGAFTVQGSADGLSEPFKDLETSIVVRPPEIKYHVKIRSQRTVELVELPVPERGL